MVRIMIEISSGGESCKEWAIVELQGDLETRHPVPLSGKLIGDLHFTQKDVPVLIIGHHILHGKMVSLEKPLAVIMKAKKDTTNHADDDDVGVVTDLDRDALTLISSEPRTKYNVEAIIRKKIIFKTRPKPIIAHVPKKI